MSQLQMQTAVTRFPTALMQASVAAAERVAVVADDDEFFRMALAAVLTQRCAFARVIQTGSYEEAIAAIEAEGHVTLALFDLNMPGMDGLDVLARQIEDQSNNTTRFLVMSPQPDLSRRGDGGMMTTFTFRVRNIPAALYKAMGGFATNGVNMTKLESYMVGGSFTATEFYADIEGHPEDGNVKLALDELRYFSSQVDILGVYPADRRRD